MKIHGFPCHVIPFLWKNSIKKVSGVTNYFWMCLGSNRPVSIWPSVNLISSSFDVLPILNNRHLTVFSVKYPQKSFYHTNIILAFTTPHSHNYHTLVDRLRPVLYQIPKYYILNILERPSGRLHIYCNQILEAFAFRNVVWDWKHELDTIAEY